MKKKRRKKTVVHSCEHYAVSSALSLTLSGIKAHGGVGRVGESFAVEHVAQSEAFDNEFLAGWSHS